MAHSPKYNCLLLAGDRGPDDPVARATGATRKALAGVGGQQMIARVLGVLAECPMIGTVTIVANNVDEIQCGITVAAVGGAVRWCEGGTSPASSVMVAQANDNSEYPVLIVTADNPLLTGARLGHFLAAADELDCDVAVGLAQKSDIAHAYPKMKRTFVNLKGEGFSGCNLFLLKSPQALAAVQFWTGIEASRKKALRMVAAFGIVTLLKVLLGKLDLFGALERVSNVVDARIAPVILDAEASIDVDRADHIPLVESILRTRT